MTEFNNLKCKCKHRLLLRFVKITGKIYASNSVKVIIKHIHVLFLAWRTEPVTPFQKSKSNFWTCEREHYGDGFEIQFGQEMMDYVLFLQRMYMDKKNFIGDFNEHIGKFHKLLT